METLREILMHSDEEDLSILAKYQKITQEYQKIPDKYSKVTYLIDQLRLNGGNTFANMVRGKGVEYDEVVRDVADQVKVNYNPKSFPGTSYLEMEIIKKLIVDDFEKMSPEQKREILESIGYQNANAPLGSAAIIAGITVARLSGFAVYRLAMIAANAIARQILGHGLKFAANAAINRTIGVALGPVGWVVGSAWLAIDLAGPAYSKTIPCVIHIAMLRQKYRISNNSHICTSCGSPIPQGNKFCGECGAKL